MDSQKTNFSSEENESSWLWIPVVNCTDEIPTAQDVLFSLPVPMLILVCLCSVFTTVNLGLYVELVVFVFRHFQSHYRRKKTLLLVAVYPVFSFSSLLGVIVPRAGTLAELTASVYLSTCMYHFVCLVMEYLGGPKGTIRALEGNPVHLNSPPLACCFPCLPKPNFKRRTFRIMYFLALQAAVVRPLLLFIAAVLWTNESYVPGQVSVDGAFLYINLLNILSTMIAMYSLVVLFRTSKEELAFYNVRFKLLCLQLVLIISSLQTIICGILVKTGVIPCVPLLSSRSRGDRLYHILITLEMLPLFLMARHFYRRETDGLRLKETMPLSLAKQLMNDKKLGDSHSSLNWEHNDAIVPALDKPEVKDTDIDEVKIPLKSDTDGQPKC